MTRDRSPRRPPRRRRLRPTVGRVARLALSLSLALAAVTVAATPAARAEGAEEGVYERQYPVSFLDWATATMVAQNQCPPGIPCVIGMVGEHAVRVRSVASVHAAIEAALRAADVAPAAQAFQVVLLRAERTGSGVPEGLPAGAAKALGDLRDFLPFSRYEMLGSAFFRTSRDAEVLVDGTGGAVFEVAMRFAGDPRQPGAELMVQAFRLRRQEGDAEAPAAPLPPPADSPAARPPSPAAATPQPPPALQRSTLLSTSFSIRRGETLVVGTSRLDGGDEALVVLLTALP